MGVGYVCVGCRNDPPLPVRWTGRCPNCGRCYDIKEKATDDEGFEVKEIDDDEVVPLQDAMARTVERERLESGIENFDAVLGGGLVPGSTVLLCGGPGSGKTTLLLHVLRELAIRRIDVLYVTGEQAVSDLALTAKRFGHKFPARLGATRQTDIDEILDKIDETEPKVVVIDSIQMVEVDEELQVGSAASVKAAIRIFKEYAEKERVVLLIIGHITKGGAISGPRTLEHNVDVVLQFEKKTDLRRVLRCPNKNRFGKIGEEAHFNMTQKGLIPVDEDADEIEEVESIPLERKR